MIFVTVGTHHQPFGRLMDALEALRGDAVIVQHGHSPAPAGVALAVPFMAFPEMEERMDMADVVVTHAGVGSILLALRCGHTPVVVPRLHRYGEHVDDHQAELAAALAQREEVVVVDDVAGLGSVLAAPPPRRPGSGIVEGPLHGAVRAALLG